MTRTERAWAAGFFDGEGWISSSRYNLKTGGMTATITIGVAQKGPELLLRFQQAVGGVGNIGGPYSKAQMWSYKAYSLETVELVVKAIWPWLGSRKREQIQHALGEAKEHRRTHPRRYLTSEQALEIRERHAQGESQAELALRFGVVKQVIWRIVHMYSHKAVTPEAIRNVAD